MTSEEHHAVCHEPDEEATCAEHQHQPDDAGPPTQQEPTEKNRIYRPTRRTGWPKK